MKLLITLATFFILQNTNGQANPDSLLGEKYYLNHGVSSSILKKKDRLSFRYNPSDLWTFDSVEYIDIYNNNSRDLLSQGIQYYYVIVNQFGDTALLPYNRLKDHRLNEYELMTPQKHASLLRKYGKGLDRLMRGWVSIGMTQQQLEIALGDPSNINSTETRRSYSQQWVYRCVTGTEYYYLENGKVTGIQR